MVAQRPNSKFFGVDAVKGPCAVSIFSVLCVLLVIVIVNRVGGVGGMLTFFAAARFSCTSTHTSCYTTASFSCTFTHTSYVMLRYC